MLAPIVSMRGIEALGFKMEGLTIFLTIFVVVFAMTFLLGPLMARMHVDFVNWVAGPITNPRRSVCRCCDAQS